VVVVSQALAQHFWPGESALGRRLVSGRPDPEGAEAPIWYEVVGVAGDVRTTSLEDDPPWMVYYSYLGLEAEDRGVEPTMSFLVRTRGAPAAVADAVRERIWALESDVAVTAVRTLDELVARARSRTAFIVVLFGLASALALLLSLVGLYGVESYIVSLRRREFGIRMAVGADRRRILRMVLGEVLLVAGAGVVAGVVIAVLPVRSMRALLFGIDVFDPATFAGTALFLIVACALASLAPAGRATRIDPQVALREE
jgi:ABC-type antimicrobial peptide transport system permease subunit